MLRKGGKLVLIFQFFIINIVSIQDIKKFEASTQ